MIKADQAILVRISWVNLVEHGTKVQTVRHIRNCTLHTCCTGPWGGTDCIVSTFLDKMYPRLLSLNFCGGDYSQLS